MTVESITPDFAAFDEKKIITMEEFTGAQRPGLPTPLSVVRGRLTFPPRNLSFAPFAAITQARLPISSSR